MLTGDLARVRVKDGCLEPRWLDGAALKRARSIAEAFRAVLAAGAGRPREAIDADLAAVEVGVRDRVLALGLKKLLSDRCEWEVRSALDPVAVRDAVFRAAARAHREARGHSRFDRAAVLAEVATALSVTPTQVDEALYADLRQNEVLTEFRDLSADELCVRYNLGLAQALLLRATRVSITLTAGEPAAVRRLFRAARFHELLHVVRRVDEGYEVSLDGPFSLFDAVQKYGLRMALFLPSVLGCAPFRLRAEVRWGRAKEPYVFELDEGAPLGDAAPPSPEPPPAVSSLRRAFEKLESPWTVRENEDWFALPGEIVCVPDLAFEHRETGEVVYLEAFGFWSRAAVWQRVELVRRGFPARILLVCSKKLRVSEEVLDDTRAGELYVYGQSPSAKEVLERLDRPTR